MTGFTGTVPSGNVATQAHYYDSSTTNLKGTSGNGTDQVWVPEIFSKNVLMKFRRESVAEGITNNDYFGEISAFGDTVKIIKEPTIAIGNYARGQQMSSTAFQDADHTLVLDQAHSFQFEVDDLEDKLAHVNWEQLASGAATYNMKMAYDLNVLKYFEDTMGTQMFANKDLAAPYQGMFIRKSTAALAAPADGPAMITELKKAANTWKLSNGDESATQINPLTLLSKMGVYLDKLDVPEEGRYVVVSPEFMELLAQVDSKLINEDFRGGSMDLSNGLQSKARVRGFEIYKSNNATDGFILGGHKSAVATANSIINTEKFRSTTSFADVVRGLHVFGRALVREEALVGAYVTY